MIVDGDLSLAHRFQQTTLCFRRGPVDFVGENDVRENRTRHEFKGLFLAVEHRDAHDVGWKKSLVNWMRLNEQSSERARLWASVVLPTPGTSSIKRCPRARRHTTAISMTCGLPLMTGAMLSCSDVNGLRRIHDGMLPKRARFVRLANYGRSLTKGPETVNFSG